MELEKIKRIVENAATNIDNDEEAFVEVNDDTEMEGNEILETTVLAKVEEVEEIKVITKLTMPSRKLKLKFRMNY
jgi:DNA polymerase-3 subunit alpha